MNILGAVGNTRTSTSRIEHRFDLALERCQSVLCPENIPPRAAFVPAGDDPARDRVQGIRVPFEKTPDRRIPLGDPRTVVEELAGRPEGSEVDASRTAGQVGDEIRIAPRGCVYRRGVAAQDRKRRIGRAPHRNPGTRCGAHTDRLRRSRRRPRATVRASATVCVRTRTRSRAFDMPARHRASTTTPAWA